MMNNRALWIVALLVFVLWRNRQTIAGVSIDALAEAIGYVESRGNYSAVGPLTDDGHRAYGKYQILDSNIGIWTYRALGRALTPAAFLNDTGAQDATARAEIARQLQQFGNAADVASVWFSGQPLAAAGDSRDVTGVTVPEYVHAVLARL